MTTTSGTIPTTQVPPTSTVAGGGMGQPPVTTPVTTPVSTPVTTTPVTTPVSTPVSTPVTIPVSIPVTVPVCTPVCTVGIPIVTTAMGGPPPVNSQASVMNQSYSNVPVTQGQPGQAIHAIPDQMVNNVLFMRDYYNILAQHMLCNVQPNPVLNQSVNSLNQSTVHCGNTSTTQAVSQPLCSSGILGPPLPAQKLVKKISLLQSTYQAFDAKEDPEFWMDTLRANALSEGLDYQHIVENIRPFFEKSSDKSVKAWFDTYRNCILEQRKKQVPYQEIWLALRKELASQFSLERRAERAAEELVTYRYTNEAANDYIIKIRGLVRKVKGDASEDEIVKNL